MKHVVTIVYLIILCSCSRQIEIPNGKVAVQTSKGKYVDSYQGPTKISKGPLEHIYIYEPENTIEIFHPSGVTLKYHIQVKNHALFYRLANCSYESIKVYYQNAIESLGVEEGNILIMQGLNKSETGVVVISLNKSLKDAP